MLNLTEVMINACVKHLKWGYHSIYGNEKSDYADIITRSANLCLGKISTTNALYHNVEHTILVTLTGQEILRGKHLRQKNVSCEDWLHSILSLLCHDIGFVKGICEQDRIDQRLYTTGIDQQMVSFSVGLTDASFNPYHVDRSKQFVLEQFAHIPAIDVETLKRNIELTRFPIPSDQAYKDTINFPGLVRAADLIGQLADPEYLQKLPALFYEFEENGVTDHLGYSHPEDLRAAYPNFFWNVVYPYLGEALKHLEVTPEGQQIVTSLYNNVLIVEQELATQSAQCPESQGVTLCSPALPKISERLPEQTWQKFNQWSESPFNTKDWFKDLLRQECLV
ncbi:MAG: Npun_R2479 family HD domain-containing metalloprotein [Halothece sp.]